MLGSVHALCSRVDALWPADSADPKALVLRFAAHHLLAAPPYLHGGKQMAHTSYVSELGIAMRKQPFRRALTGKLSDAFVGTPFFRVTKTQEGDPLVTLDIAALLSRAPHPAGLTAAVSMAEPSTLEAQLCSCGSHRLLMMNEMNTPGRPQDPAAFCNLTCRGSP